MASCFSQCLSTPLKSWWLQKECIIADKRERALLHKQPKAEGGGGEKKNENTGNVYLFLT